MNRQARTGLAAGRHRAARWIVGSLLGMPTLYREFRGQITPVTFAGSGLEPLGIRLLRFLDSCPDLHKASLVGFMCTLPAVTLVREAAAAVDEVGAAGLTEIAVPVDAGNLRLRIVDALYWLRLQDEPPKEPLIDLDAALRQAQEEHFRKGKR